MRAPKVLLTLTVSIALSGCLPSNEPRFSSRGTGPEQISVHNASNEIQMQQQASPPPMLRIASLAPLLAARLGPLPAPQVAKLKQPNALSWSRPVHLCGLLAKQTTTWISCRETCQTC